MENIWIITRKRLTLHQRTNKPTKTDNGEAPAGVAAEHQNIQNISATKVGNFP